MGMNGNAWVNFVYEPGGSLMYLIINPAQDLAGTILGPEGKVEIITIGYDYGRICARLLGNERWPRDSPSG